MQRDVLSYVPITLRFKTLVDCGACISAISQKVYEKLKRENLINDSKPIYTCKNRLWKPVKVQTQA